jgi:hypothetical protein
MGGKASAPRGRRDRAPRCWRFARPATQFGRDLQPSFRGYAPQQDASLHVSHSGRPRMRSWLLRRGFFLAEQKRDRRPTRVCDQVLSLSSARAPSARTGSNRRIPWRARSCRSSSCQQRGRSRRALAQSLGGRQSSTSPAISALCRAIMDCGGSGGGIHDDLFGGRGCGGFAAIGRLLGGGRSPGACDAGVAGQYQELAL